MSVTDRDTLETVEKLLKISGAWDQFKGTTPAAPAVAAEAEAS